MASEGQNKPPELGSRADAATSANHAVMAAAAAYPNSNEWHAMYPYVWPGQMQHVMPAYGTPMPYPPFHSAPYYPHPSMAVSMAYAMGESEGRQTEGKEKNKGSSGTTPEKSRDGGKGTSGSGNMASQSSCDEGSDDSSGTRDDDAEAQGSSAKKRKYGKSFTEGESSQALALYNNTTTNDSSQHVRARAASKLPVSAPGRAAVTPPATNLHMGMDIWNTSHTSALALNSRPDVAHHQLDERELKRERRKQSNRESARRSRLRKQQECEDLGKKVKELTSENSDLKAKVLELKEACQNVETENKQLMEEMIQKHGPEIITTLCLNSSSLTEENGGNANSN
ncbi:G-box binding factor 1 [Rhynchospora pubera]|uniref:G-box binding factor 1 n=1 Tax=Rhynchospora pubera TaxID=906938 RepID=A0AAV8HCW7_9POAL|nr:G-box binding factor 1 [Rhynchospora pubera]